MAIKLKHSKRTAFRFKLANKNITYMAKGHLGKAKLLNVSTSGCFATNNSTALNIDDQLLIIIELPKCDRPLKLKAKVLRIDEGGFSAVFTDIEECFVTEFSTMLAIEHRNYQQN